MILQRYGHCVNSSYVMSGINIVRLNKREEVADIN